MKPTCPKCNVIIPPSQINVATDVAACPQCNEAFALSQLVAETVQDAPETFDITNPPHGAWFAEGIREWRIGASTRSYMAWILVPFMCVWSGGSMGGIYGSQIMHGKFDIMMSLFGIPFLIGTLFLGSAAIMSLFGRVDVSVVDNQGTVFVGVGPFGWTRRFDWSEITRIEEDLSSNASANNNRVVISLVGKTRLKFGSMLNESRRYYILQGLKLLHQRAKGS